MKGKVFKGSGKGSSLRLRLSTFNADAVVIIRHIVVIHFQLLIIFPLPSAVRTINRGVKYIHASVTPKPQISFIKLLSLKTSSA